MTQSRRIVSEHIDDGFLELWRSNHVDLAADGEHRHAIAVLH
jgi:hypothetical protein